MKLKALNIYDNEQNMYMFSFLLEKNNYEVMQAFSKNLLTRIILFKEWNHTFPKNLNNRGENHEEGLDC